MPIPTIAITPLLSVRTVLRTMSLSAKYGATRAQFHPALRAARLSPRRQGAYYQTLKPFGQIVKSLFILCYVDVLDLRQAIEMELNKVKFANRFTRAVAVGNPSVFAQTGKEEQEIAEGCSRLIMNGIICWIYLYFVRRL